VFVPSVVVGISTKSTTSSKAVRDKYRYCTAYDVVVLVAVEYVVVGFASDNGGIDHCCCGSFSVLVHYTTEVNVASILQINHHLLLLL
jgi:hypothetical protein